MNLRATFSEFPVLYVEDEVLVSLDLHQMLQDIGIDDLTIANSHQEAVAEIERRQFALGILDVNLGGGQSSFDLARELRRQDASVIFTTGYNASELPKEFEWAVVLEKPVMLGMLQSAILKVAA